MIRTFIIGFILFNLLQFSMQLNETTCEPNKIDNIITHFKELDPSIAEDAALTADKLITKYGYKSEVHNVITKDGYILEMHRIPKPGAQPVYLMHGLLDSSSTWVIMGPKHGFAYILSDLGYDVWMGNARGNRYSRKHISLNPDSRKFWQFSFHEIGTIDVKASIDYILEKTAYEKLHYIGHSQGTIAFWIFCTQNPDYTDKIISMQALAPVAYSTYVRSPMANFITFFMNKFSFLTKLIGLNEFLPNSKFIAKFSSKFCKDGSIVQPICTNIIFLMTGYNEKQTNKTMLPVILGHTPAGASTKQIIHFSQLSKTGKFCQYDYGMLGNMYNYRSMSPPDYDISKVNVKVGLFYSTNDWLSHPYDVEKLHQALPKPVGKFLIEDREFNHLDFVWGIDVKTLVFDRVTKLMELIERGEMIL